MEKQELNNSTLILVFGILSMLGCCFWGVLGIIFGIITLVMANRAREVYYSDPEIYTGYENVKTGRILAIIGIVLSIISFIIAVVGFIIYGGFEGIQSLQEEILST